MTTSSQSSGGGGTHRSSEIGSSPFHWTEYFSFENNTFVRWDEVGHSISRQSAWSAAGRGMSSRVLAFFTRGVTFEDSRLENAFLQTSNRNHKVPVILCLFGAISQIVYTISQGPAAAKVFYIDLILALLLLFVVLPLILGIMWTSTDPIIRCMAHERAVVVGAMMVIGGMAISLWPYRVVTMELEVDQLRENSEKTYLGYGFRGYSFSMAPISGMAFIGALSMRIHLWVWLCLGILLCLTLSWWVWMPRVGSSLRLWPLLFPLDIWYAVLIMTSLGVAKYFNEIQSRERLLAALDAYMQQVELKRLAGEVNSVVQTLLPSTVIKRLLAREHNIVDSRVSTVLIGDLAGFTQWCASRPTRVVVDMLSSVVAELDRSALLERVQKVKTIGDAYWTVCNVPDAVPDHTLRTVRFAIGAHLTMERLCQARAARGELEGPVACPAWGTLQFRIGIHVGPVIGTVFGRRFSYEIYGLVTQVAELLEQTAEVGGVQISQAAEELLRSQEEIESKAAAAAGPNEDCDCGRKAPPLLLSSLFGRLDTPLKTTLVEAKAAEEEEGEIVTFQLADVCAKARANDALKSVVLQAAKKDTELTMNDAASDPNSSGDVDSFKKQLIEHRASAAGEGGDDEWEQGAAPLTTGGTLPSADASAGSSETTESFSKLSVLAGYRHEATQAKYMSYRFHQSGLVIPMALSGFVFAIYIFFLVVLVMEEKHHRSEFLPHMVAYTGTATVGLVSCLILRRMIGSRNLDEATTPYHFLWPSILCSGAILIGTVLLTLMDQDTYETIPSMGSTKRIAHFLPLYIWIRHSEAPPRLAMIAMIISCMVTLVLIVFFYNPVGGLRFLSQSNVIWPNCIVALVYIFFKEKSYQAGFELQEEISGLLERSKEEERILRSMLEISMPRHVVPFLMERFATPASSAANANSSSELAYELEDVAVMFVSLDLGNFLAATGASSVDQQYRFADGMSQSLTLVENLIAADPRFREITFVKNVGNVLLLAGSLDPAQHRSSGPEMALNMLAFAEALHRKVEQVFSSGGATLRIGMHIGPVSAAVIGRRQLMYDVFGSTVNIASRVMTTLPKKKSAGSNLACGCSNDFQQQLQLQMRKTPSSSPDLKVELNLGSLQHCEGHTGDSVAVLESGFSVFAKGVGAMPVSRISFSQN